VPVPCGAVPVELWMLIFGFVRRDVPVQYKGRERVLGMEVN
jgi:hypothetical protein